MYFNVSVCFKKIFLSIVFSSNLIVRFFGVSFNVYFVQATLRWLDLWVYSFYEIWNVFGHYLFMAFYLTSLFSPFWDSKYCSMSFLTSVKIHFFPRYFPSLFFSLGNFYSCVFKFPDFLLLSNLLLLSSIECFISDFLTDKLLGLFFRSSTSLLIVLIFF